MVDALVKHKDSLYHLDRVEHRGVLDNIYTREGREFKGCLLVRTPSSMAGSDCYFFPTPEGVQLITIIPGKS